jgi:hypothetical protein
MDRPQQSEPNHEPEPEQQAPPSPEVSDWSVTPASERETEPRLAWSGQPEPAVPTVPAASLPESQWTPSASYQPGYQQVAPQPQWDQYSAQQYAPPPRPKLPPRPVDPLAVAVGNASLFGVGYVLLGRKGLAVATTLVTAVLVVVLGPIAHAVWLEFVVVLWWLALIAHGWFLARTRPRPNQARTQRLVALAVTVPVLLAFGLLRFDAERIDTATTQARAAGDCAQARTATDRLWFGHRLVDAPVAASTDETVAACDQLSTAAGELTDGLTGDTGSLKAGFADLSAVLTGPSGHETMVATTLGDFLDKLPVENPCDTKAITDWLRGEKPRGAVLGAATDIVPGIAPAAIVECADTYMKGNNWTEALRDYQQLLKQYPNHKLAPKAKAGATKATQAIELARLRTLLTSSGGTEPEYCATPSPYSAAAPYAAGRPNRALVFGNTAHTGKIPPGWLARDAAEAVVVICAGETEYGTPVETCPYESKIGLYGSTDVTFRKIAIPTRVFEVRTGKLVADFKVEIGGASCPNILEYTSIGYSDFGPPSEVYVAASIADVQAAFRPLLIP